LKNRLQRFSTIFKTHAHLLTWHFSWTNLYTALDIVIQTQTFLYMTCKHIDMFTGTGIMWEAHLHILQQLHENNGHNIGKYIYIYIFKVSLVIYGNTCTILVYKLEPSNLHDSLVRHSNIYWSHCMQVYLKSPFKGSIILQICHREGSKNQRTSWHVQNNVKILLHSVFHFFKNTKFYIFHFFKNINAVFYIHRKIYTEKLRKKFQWINVKILYSFLQFSKNIKFYAFK
jgi:hypothetical protein